MHFVGMLAFHLPVFYYWPTVVADLTGKVEETDFAPSLELPSSAPA
jgi:hypothetical protein